MMLHDRWIVAGMALGCAVVPGCRNGGASVAPSLHEGSARTVTSQPLSPLQGDHLAVTLVEVTYAPGEGSPPHRHPCAVVGYVLEGRLRTQVSGMPETTFGTGESFYESPNSAHLVSANASTTEPVRFLAWFTCDQEGPLSVPVHDASTSAGQRP